MMIKVNKLPYDKLFCFFTAIAAFLKMNPYFTWEADNWLAIIYNVGFSVLAVLFGLLSFKPQVNVHKTVAAAFIFLFGICVCISGGYNLSNAINASIMYLLGALLIMKPEEIRNNTFRLFYKIFAISLIPALVYYALFALGVQLPYNVIYPTNELKLAYGHYYQQYPGAVFYMTQNAYALCGMMDEPGVIGTFGGLLLAVKVLTMDRKNIRKQIQFWDIVILLAGFLCQSKAFLILLEFAIVLRLFMEKSVKALSWLSVVAVMGIVLLNLETDYQPLLELQEIAHNFLETGDLGLARTGKGFEAGFQAFLEGPVQYVLFGHGYMASQAVDAFFGSAEIRMLVYDIGVVGVGFLLLWIVYVAKGRRVNKTSLFSGSVLFAALFILSMLQRQYVTTLDYIVLLVGGSSYITLQNYENEYKKGDSLK